MTNRHLAICLWFLFFFLIGLRIIPYIYPLSRTWGFNHFIFLTSPEKAVVLALLIAALVVAINTISIERIGKFAGLFSRSFFDSEGRHLYRLIFLLFCLFLFVFVPVKTHFLGDGYQSLSNLAKDYGTFLKWTEKGAWSLLLIVQTVTGGSGLDSALLAFRIISWVAGIVSIWFFFGIADVLADNPMKRLLIFFSCLLGGSLLLFFGYVESYPAIWIGFTAFLYFGLKYLVTGRGLVFCAAGLGFATFIHLQAGFMIPSLFFLLGYQPRVKQIFDANKTYILSSALILIIVAFSFFIHFYRSDIGFRGIFLPFGTGFAYAPHYTLFSIYHIVDLLNEYLLLSPALPIFLFLAVATKSSLVKSNATLFLLIASAGLFLFCFFIDPKLGMPRDWDLFSLSALPLTILFIVSLNARAERLMIKLCPAILIYGCVSTIPFLVTNIRTSASLRYTEFMIDLDHGKSLQTLGLMGNYYQEKGLQQKADSVRVLLDDCYPDRRKAAEAMTAVERGDIDKARRIALTINPDEYSVDYLALLTVINYKEGNYRTALGNIQLAIQANRYMPDLYIYQSRILQKLNDFQGSRYALQLAHVLDTKNMNVLAEIANLSLLTNQNDSVLHFSEAILNIDSLNPDGLYYASIAFFKEGHRDSALYYERLHAEHGNSHPLYERRKKELSELTGSE